MKHKFSNEDKGKEVIYSPPKTPPQDGRITHVTSSGKVWVVLNNKPPAKLVNPYHIRLKDGRQTQQPSDPEGS